MKKQILLIAVLILIVGCIEIVPKNKQATTIDSVSQQQQNLDQNQPPTQLDQNQFPPTADQNQPSEQPDQNQPQEPLDPEQPLPLPPKSRPAWVELWVNTKLVYLNEGEFVEINGAQSFAGTQFLVFLENIASTGGTYAARFRLENNSSEQIDKRSFITGEDLYFEDPNGNTVAFDGILSIQGIYAG